MRLGVQNLLEIGFTKILLNIVNNKKSELAQLFDSNSVFWQYLGATILYGLIVLGGLILLIIPGIYWSIKYQFAMTLVVDKKNDPIEAFKLSAKMTERYKWKLFYIELALLLLNVLGFLAIGLGLLITIPITLIAHIYIYRELQRKIIR